MSEAELLAYFAGVTDSDGSLTITKRAYDSKKLGMRRYYFPEIRIAMKSKVTIAHLYSIVNKGKVYSQKDGTTLLHIYGSEAVEVIHLIEKYMVTKRPQAILILEFIEDPQYPPGYYFQRIRDLKKIALTS